MTDRTTRPDHWHKWPFEVDCGIPEERFTDEAAAHPPATAHDFEPMRGPDDTTCSRCLRVHPPATVPEPPLPRGWRPDTATIPEPGTPPATVPELHPDDGHEHRFGCRLCGVDAPPATVPDEGLTPERLARALWAFHHEAEEGPYDDATAEQREFIHTNAEWLFDYAATKAQEP